MTTRIAVIRMRAALCGAALVAVAIGGTVAQEPQQPEMPRFRAGANLVRVDAYVTADGKAVPDLTIDDFEVLEDGRPQRLESFEIIKPRGPAAQNARIEPTTVAQSRAMAADPNARLFVLFLDIWHTRIDGSYHAQGPITRLLERLIGQDDLVGLMTSDMRASQLTLARRTTTIEGILRDTWYWGRPSLVRPDDPREERLKSCYGPGLAAVILARLREQQTLEAIEDLVAHLENLREERKFVVLVTEGWRLYTPDARLGGPEQSSQGPAGKPVGIGVDPATGMPRVGTSDTGDFSACERDRQTAAAMDNKREFTLFVQRANRANVSFYPVDTRGLGALEAPIAAGVPTQVDLEVTRGKHESLRTLALDTDGYAIVDTNAIDRGLERMVADTNLYYLLGYYSTNTRLDGKFRKLTVRVKRAGVDVRSRPGYLAPTPEDADASPRAAASAAARQPDPAPEVRRALDRLTAARVDRPLRATAIAAGRSLWITAELDAATARGVAWQKGGTARVTLLREGSAVALMSTDAALAPGLRALTIVQATDALPQGRYTVRMAMTPAGGASPLRVDSTVVVEDSELIGASGLVLRRGPATGTQYLPTADLRFQRTERLRLEVPRFAPGGVVTARLLGRTGAALPVNVAVTEREDSERGSLVVADLTLAPLAQGDYVVEVLVEKEGARALATHAFRLVP